MKRLLTLIAITLVASLSMSVSAQSSRLIGEWESSAGAQIAAMEAIGAKYEKIASTQRFNEDGTYRTYVYFKATINMQGIEMHMTMEYTEQGTWFIEGDELAYTSNDMNFQQLDISFSDPSLNALSEEVKTGMKQSFTSVIGTEVRYKIEFITDYKVRLTMENDQMPLEFYLTRDIK